MFFFIPFPPQNFILIEHISVLSKFCCAHKICHKIYYSLLNRRFNTSSVIIKLLSIKKNFFQKWANITITILMAWICILIIIEKVVCGKNFLWSHNNFFSPFSSWIACIWMNTTGTSPQNEMNFSINYHPFPYFHRCNLLHRNKWIGIQRIFIAITYKYLWV